MRRARVNHGFELVRPLLRPKSPIWRRYAQLERCISADRPHCTKVVYPLQVGRYIPCGLLITNSCMHSVLYVHAVITEI